MWCQCLGVQDDYIVVTYQAIRILVGCKKGIWREWAKGLCGGDRVVVKWCVSWVGGSNEGYAFSSVQVTPKGTKKCTGSFDCHQLLMRLPSAPHDLPNLVISTSSQTTTHQLHISFSSYCIHMALHTSNFLQVLLHACYHPSLQMSFLCFAVKAGHWFPPDSKDHTHRLGVPSFSKKEFQGEHPHAFLLHQRNLLHLLVLSSFQSIALMPCMNLFGS